MREGALAELASAIAALPLDLGRLEQARGEVERVGGRELLAEACAVAGAFEAITKLVDATGREVPSIGFQRFKGVVMTLMKHRTAIGWTGASLVAACATQMFLFRQKVIS